MPPQQQNPQHAGANTLAALLTTLQQGVTAINNLTQTAKLVWPSS